LICGRAAYELRTSRSRSLLTTGSLAGRSACRLIASAPVGLGVARRFVLDNPQGSDS